LPFHWSNRLPVRNAQKREHVRYANLMVSDT
jgi:hypothetical protein